jgi:translation initiation factor 2B subunit (eIF-2B alpha/beta/delta family)
VLNLKYDVTPGHFLDMVISEAGSIPVTSVAVILREYMREDFT